MTKNVRDRVIRIIRNIEGTGYEVIVAIDPSLPFEVKLQRENEAKILLDEARANGERIYSIPVSCTLGYYENRRAKVAVDA